MATLTVGPGKTYATLALAVAASGDGDTINVQAGTYTDDLVTFTKKLTVNGIGGLARFTCTKYVANGKGIFVIDNDVTLDHLELAGACDDQENGAAVRYENGTLTLTNCWIHDNQDGILAGGVGDGTGVITIDRCEFDHNGLGRDGRTHNVYIGIISSLSFTNSYSHDANEGHQLKSRAYTNVITNNRFDDGNNNSSYSVDIPQGGATTIQNNVIRQGPYSENGGIISYATETTEAGGSIPINPGSSLQVSNNTIINDIPQAVYAMAVVNGSTSVTASITNNTLYGIRQADQFCSANFTQSGNSFLFTGEPAVDSSHPWTGSSADNAATNLTRHYVPTAPANHIALTMISGSRIALLDGTGNGPVLANEDTSPYVVGGSNLSISGSDLVAAIRVETGYLVAWKSTGLDQYSLWYCVDQGAGVANVVRFWYQYIPAANPLVDEAESLFQVDIDSDGFIAPPPIRSSRLTCDYRRFR